MISELKFALRQFAKAPGFTLVALLSLAIGIGATTTVFCWIQSIVFHPVPGARQENQLAVLVTDNDKQQWDTASLPDLIDARGLTDVFAGVIGSQVTPACLTVDGHSEWIYGQIATANFFSVLGVQPLLGRTFLPDEDRKVGGDSVLVLSETFWRRRFDADPAVIGKTVEINLHPFTIVGIAPAAFHGTMNGLVCDFWAPVSMHQAVANFGSESRYAHYLHAQVRLQPGVTLQKAQAALDTFSAQLEKAYPNSNKLITLRLLPFAQAPYGAQSIFVRVFAILMAVCVGVLLMVAANVANLLLARATDRRKEIAIRLAMGAGRGRLIRQLLTESLLLALAGGVLGAALASWSVSLLRASLPHTYLPLGIGAALDGGTLGFTLLLSLGTGVVFGLVPALQASRQDLQTTLKEGGRGSGSVHHRLRNVLVISEVALALMLLVGAGLCIKSARRSTQADLGFDPSHVLLTGLRIGMNGYTEKTGMVFYQRLQQRLLATPGVQSAALSTYFPLGFEGDGEHRVSVDGHPRQTGEDDNFNFSVVSPGYFGTLRVPLVAGRDFTDRDDQSAAQVGIINETMAQRFWPGQDPLGRKFRENGQEVTVVGVAKAGKYRHINEPPACFFYRPYRQGISELNLGVCLRAAGDPAAMADTLQRVIHELDPRVEVWVTIPMPVYIEAAFLAPRMASRLMTGLGLVALGLAAIGVYGVVAYIVGQRTREFGIRLALGATAADLLRLVLRKGLILTAAGVGAGLLLAAAAARSLAAFLYGVQPFDPAIFAVVPVLLIAASLLASWLPARRAARVDPLIALRSE